MNLNQINLINKPFSFSGAKSLIVFAVLALACLAGFSSRLFAVIRYSLYTLMLPLMSTQVYSVKDYTNGCLHLQI